jgi:uncharacterized repeat protein (TIGR01451 family)
VTQGQILTPAEAAQLKFQPNSSYTGNATFTYSATDNSGAASTPATVTIPVTAPPNTSPTATNDSGFTNPGVPVNIDVLDNDTDANGDTLTVTSFTQPANGTVSCTPAGACTYTPNPGFTGTDTYTYTISDGKGGTATATVKITVPIPANQPPVPENKTAPSTPNNTPVLVPALSATDANAGDTIASYTISTLPLSSQGVLLLNGQPVTAGQILTPAEAAQLKFQPNSSFTGDASFTYTATDNNGALSASPAAVTLPVTAPPKAKLRLVKRITRINSTEFKDLANDTDDTNATGWPINYLEGKTDAGQIKPGDEIEYTIYFLSDGDVTANNVTICDLIPQHLTFMPNAFDPGKGISVSLNGSQPFYTNAADGDGGQFYPAGTSVPVSCGGSNTNGAVVVNLGNIPSATGATPSNSYGFVRFRAKFQR